MVQIWDMVQKVLAFYCWQDETELSSIWGVQSVHGHNTAGVTPLALREDAAPARAVLLVLMMHLKRQRERFLRNTWMACDHPRLLWLITAHLNKIYLSRMFSLFCSLLLRDMKRWSDGRKTDRCYPGSLRAPSVSFGFSLSSRNGTNFLKTERSPLAQKLSK